MGGPAVCLQSRWAKCLGITTCHMPLLTSSGRTVAVGSGAHVPQAEAGTLHIHYQTSNPGKVPGIKTLQKYVLIE